MTNKVNIAEKVGRLNWNIDFEGSSSQKSRCLKGNTSKFINPDLIDFMIVILTMYISGRSHFIQVAQVLS